MSVINRKQIITEGDQIILWGGREDITWQITESGKTFHNRRGKFHHNDIIGRPFGTKIWSQNQTGWFFALAPTVELWSKALKFRTQILYHADISAICHYLDLKPGQVVVESGTGSGALSTAMARCVAPDGKLLTFEFNKNRVEAAKVDFKNNKLDHIIDVTWRDALKDGFRLKNVADAVFLDLPAPWDVLASADEALIEGGKLCSFSPCIEQVQRVCVKLDEMGYAQIETIECLIRPHDVYNNPVSFYKFEDHSEAQAAEAAGQKKRKLDEDGAGNSEASTTSTAAVSTTAEITTENMNTEAVTTKEDSKPLKRAPQAPRLEKEEKSVVVTKPVINIAGHTGFLTFARKPPAAPKTMSE